MIKLQHLYGAPEFKDMYNVSTFMFTLPMSSYLS